MSSTERLRTFLAVYRAGSVTNGARHRHITQPAASQQLASLERAVGAPLFSRIPSGVEPTARGRELYGLVAQALDRLEPVLSGLEGGPTPGGIVPVRIGTRAEYFSARLVPMLAACPVGVSARFGPDEEILGLLETGEVDIAVTSMSPGRRGMSSMATGSEAFALVAAPHCAPDAPLDSAWTAAEWLTGRPWVAYSHELPITRRFWQRTLGRPFAADLRLTAPDLRAVAEAAAAGLGISLLPTFVVDDLIRRGRLVEILEIADTVPSQPWFATTLDMSVARDDVARVWTAMSGTA